jgi:hypothetical protein
MNGKLLVAGGSFDFLLLTFEFSKLVRVAGCWRFVLEIVVEF